MNFYAVEERLAEAIDECRTRVRVRVSFDFAGDGVFVPVPETDVIELDVTSLREKKGGTITWATLILDNTIGSYCPRHFDDYRPEYSLFNGPVQEDGMGNLRPGRAVEIAYTTGNDIPFVKRFALFVDDNGFQQTAEGSRGRYCKIRLVDLASKLKETDKQKDWTNPEVIVHSVICDKEFPEDSIVHRIAGRAGLGVSDIDCSTVREYLPYVKLTRSVWDELSDVARVYRAHLETAMEKPLVFVTGDDAVQYVFDHRTVTHARIYDLREQYRNTIRIRWTRYNEYPAVELWRYTDPPVVYTPTLTPTYPFIVDGEKRDIEHAGYSAWYSVRTSQGRVLTVVYAEQIDDQSTFEANMVTDGPALPVTVYDTTTWRDRAILRLEPDVSTILLDARIFGNAIAAEQNFSHYIHDEAEVAANGTVALNVSTPYLSETEREGVPYYEWYANHLLEKLTRARKGFFLKTHRALFQARVGAAVAVNLANGLVSERAEIVEMELRYAAREPFVATFFLEEE